MFLPKFSNMKKKVLLTFGFVFAVVLFIAGSGVSTYAKDLGFAPALIDTANCLIGSAPCEPESAQEVYLFQPGPNSISAIDGAGALIDTLYVSPPSSSIVWAYDLYQRTQDRELLSVYAQDPDDDNFNSVNNNFYFPGLGYNLLLPMLDLWQWSRNMVYAFYVVIVIVLAFLILFRQSLGGQTAVSIINSIPSLIVSLVLVSLSYPIAGFFVDFIFIGSNVVQSTLLTSPTAPGYEFVTSTTNLDISKDDPDKPDLYYLQPDDPFVSVWAIWGTSNAEIFRCEGTGEDEECVNNIVPDGIDVGNLGLLKFVGSVVPLGEEAANNAGFQEVGNTLLDLVLGLAAFMAAFRLFLALLKNYVTLAISPIFLPWLFFIAAIPSKTKSSIINAIKPLAAASITFIVVYAVFLLMIIIGRSEALGISNAGEFRFTPPLLGYSSDQISTSASITKALVIYIIFLATPTIPDMVNNFLNVQSSSQTMGQVGQTTSKAAGQVFGGLGAIFKGKKK